MKKISILVLLSLVFPSLMAQEEEPVKNRDEIHTLFGGGRNNGGYGALSMLYSEIDKENAIVFGARGAWIIDHGLAIGLAGSGFLNEARFDADINENVSLAGGYGGLLFEPILLPRFPIHISLPVIVGVGGVAYTIVDYESWDNYGENYVEDSGVFLVAEPGVELEFNLLRYFRLSVGGYYRFTSNLSLMNTNPDALKGLSFGITFKFGSF